MIELKEQIQKGIEISKQRRVDFKPEKIIFCAMGGSIIPAEIISMLWIDDLNCYLNRTAYLPDWAGKNHLVICISWSGETEETISCFKEAIGKNIPAVSITKGGKLAKEAKENNQILITLPKSNVPARYGALTMTAAILTLLNNSDIIRYNLPESPEINRKSIVLLAKLQNRIPLIYSSYPWRYLASFWKIFFNETCKIPAFSNHLPSMAHNEIASMSTEFFPVILIGQDENPQDLKVLNKFSLFLKSKSIEHEIIYIEGKDRLEKILNSYHLIIQTTNALAKSLDLDPFELKAVDEFKNI